MLITISAPAGAGAGTPSWLKYAQLMLLQAVFGRLVVVDPLPCTPPGPVPPGPQMAQKYCKTMAQNLRQEPNIPSVCILSGSRYAQCHSGSGMRRQVWQQVLSGAAASLAWYSFPILELSQRVQASLQYRHGLQSHDMATPLRP